MSDRHFDKKIRNSFKKNTGNSESGKTLIKHPNRTFLGALRNTIINTFSASALIILLSVLLKFKRKTNLHVEKLIIFSEGSPPPDSNPNALLTKCTINFK